MPHLTIVETTLGNLRLTVRHDHGFTMRHMTNLMFSPWAMAVCILKMESFLCILYTHGHT
jgi:hypothetical protein